MSHPTLTLIHEYSTKNSGLSSPTHSLEIFEVLAESIIFWNDLLVAVSCDPWCGCIENQLCCFHSTLKWWSISYWYASLNNSSVDSWLMQWLLGCHYKWQLVFLDIMHMIEGGVVAKWFVYRFNLGNKFKNYSWSWHITLLKVIHIIHAIEVDPYVLMKPVRLFLFKSPPKLALA